MYLHLPHFLYFKYTKYIDLRTKLKVDNLEAERRRYRKMIYTKKVKKNNRLAAGVNCDRRIFL